MTDLQREQGCSRCGSTAEGAEGCGTHACMPNGPFYTLVDDFFRNRRPKKRSVRARWALR